MAHPPDESRTGSATDAPADADADPDAGCDAGEPRRCEPTRFAIFTECPLCGGGMASEHAHYRCTTCGWRDSCCD